MSNIVSRLKKFNQALQAIKLDEIYHYEALEKTSKYIVWSEEGMGDALFLNDKQSEFVIEGVIDLFSKEEFDTLIDELQDTLNANCVSNNLVMVDYEVETGYIHYQWKWEL